MVSRTPPTVMRSEVGRHHNVALLQRGDEFLPKVGEEQFTVCGSVDDHRRGQAIVTQRRDERGRLPMAVRPFSDESLTKFRQRRVSLLTHQLLQGFAMRQPLRRGCVPRFPRRHLATLATPLLEPPNPRLAPAILHRRLPHFHSRVTVREHSFSQIHRASLDGNSSV